MENTINSMSETQMTNSDQNCLILNISENEFSQSEVSDDNCKVPVDPQKISYHDEYPTDSALTEDEQIVNKRIEFAVLYDEVILDNSESDDHFGHFAVPSTVACVRGRCRKRQYHEIEDVLEGATESEKIHFKRFSLGCVGNVSIDENSAAAVKTKKIQKENAYGCMAANETESWTLCLPSDQNLLCSDSETPLQLLTKELGHADSGSPRSSLLLTEDSEPEVVSEISNETELLQDGFSDENINADLNAPSKMCPTSCLNYSTEMAVNPETVETENGSFEIASRCESIKERLGKKVVSSGQALSDLDDGAFKDHRVVLINSDSSLKIVHSANNPCLTKRGAPGKRARCRRPARKRRVRSCTITSQGQINNNDVPEQPPAVDVMAPNVTSTSHTELINGDLEENLDNNDSDWQYVLMLNSDDERYKATRMRWKNLTIPNPNVSLTVQNYRMRSMNYDAIAANGPVTKKGRKRALLPTPVEQLQVKRLREMTEVVTTCSDVFAAKMGCVHDSFKYRELSLIDEFNSQLDSLAARHATETKNFRMKWQKMVLSGKYPLKQQYHAQLMALKRKHQKQRDTLARKRRGALESVWNERQGKIRKLAEAQEEILAVHRFYYGLRNSTNEERDANLLDNKQLMDIEDCEKMYDLYERFYA